MPFHFIQFWGKEGEMTCIYQCGIMLSSASMPLAVTSEDECQTKPANNSRAIILSYRHPEGEQPR